MMVMVSPVEVHFIASLRCYFLNRTSWFHRWSYFPGKVMHSYTSDRAVNDSQAKGTTRDEDNSLKDPRLRAGSMPFMSLEVLDQADDDEDIEYHLCHDLESILYAALWRGGKTFRHSFRGLLGTRSIMRMKKALLNNPEPTILEMTDRSLQQFCRSVVSVFHKRRDDAQIVFKEEMENICWMIRQARKLRAMGLDINPEYKIPLMKYEIAIYPKLAEVLDMDVPECRRVCCRSERASRAKS